MKKIIVAILLVVLVAGTTYYVRMPKLQVIKTNTQGNEIIEIDLNSKKIVNSYFESKYDQQTSEYLTSLVDINIKNKMLIEKVDNYLVISPNFNDEQYYYDTNKHQAVVLTVKDEYLDLVENDYANILKENNVEGAYTSKIKELINIDYDFRIINNKLVFMGINGLEISYDLDPYLNMTTLGDGEVYTSLLHPLYHYINPDLPIVVLTMDDGPIKEDLDIIELFNEYQVSGTFFQVAKRIYNMEEVELAIINQGSEIGSHSYSHPYLTKIKDDEELLEEMTKTDTFLKEYTNGEYQVKYLRPPYGAFNEHVQEVSPYPTVMWSIDTEDWKNKDTDTIIKRIDDNIKDGSVILMHDVHVASREAMLSVIPYLLDAGYQVCSLTDLANARNVTFEPGEIVHHVYK